MIQHGLSLHLSWASTMHRYHRNAGLMVDNHFEYSLAMVGCLKKHRKIRVVNEIRETNIVKSSGF